MQRLFALCLLINLTVCVAAHGQSLESVASYVGQSVPAGTNLVYGVEFSGNRLIVAISNTLRIMSPTQSGWAMLPQVISAPSADVVGFGQWIRGDAQSIAVGCESGHVFVYDMRAEPNAPIASWRNPTGARVTVLTVDGERILVGTPTTDGTAGGGYILRRSGSSLVVEQRFIDPSNPTSIGWSGGMSGEEVVLSGEGSASYWHARAWRRFQGQWNALGALSPEGAQGNPIFGCSSSVEGAVLAIGARDEATAGWQSGACFIFERSPSGWSQVAKITLDSPPFNNQETGGSVTVAGGKVWVSAAGNMENGVGDRGRTLVVSKRNGQWSIEQVLRAPESGYATFWGYSPRVAANGMVATFGADSPTPFSTWRPRLDVLAPFNDCDNNGLNDVATVLNGVAVDLNRDTVPDTCQCVADLNGDGRISGGDLGLLFVAWGRTGPGVAEDLNHDGHVDGADIQQVLADWGPCPN